MMKNKDFEDDGRTVADMSSIERQPLFLPKINFGQSSKAKDDTLTPRQRGMYILGALGAALLIAAVFGMGLGLIIWLITLLK